MSKTSEALDELVARLARTGIEGFLENTQTLVVTLDSRGVASGWNPAFDTLGDSQPGITALQDLLPPSARPRFEQSLEHVMQSGESARLKLPIGEATDGIEYDCLLMAQSDRCVLLIADPGGAPGTIQPENVQNAEGELARVKAELEDARQALGVKQKELQAVLVQTDEVAHTDSLTLLPNRRWILNDLQQQVTYSERYGTPLSVSMIDLDNFKDVNDALGHAAGDQVLRFIASEMRDRIRQPDQIGRYGGDEFLVILPNTPVTAAAEQASRLCQQIRAMPVVAGHDMVRVTLSIGIAQYRPGQDDWRTLIDRADQALYQAKHNGRSQWAILKS